MPPSTRLRWSIPALALTLLSLVATPSHAAGQTQDAQLDRLATTGHSLKWNYTPQGKNGRYGHSEVLINAPMAAVRSQVLDFSHYKEFAPDKFKNARMIAKSGPNVDVYFQVPIMHGMMTLWYVSRFGALRQTAPGVETVEGNFVKGNIKDMNIVLTMRSIDPQWTILSCDLLLLPNMPAPQGAVDEELRDAAMQAVDAIKDRAQGRKGDVPFPGIAAAQAPAQPTPPAPATPPASSSTAPTDAPQDPAPKG